MIKALIFDFNGVIVESTDTNAQIYADIFSFYGTDVAKKVMDHYNNTGGIPRQARIEYYLREFAGIEPTRELINKLSKEFSHRYLNSLKYATLVPCARDFLAGYGRRYDKFLSSGAPQEDIPLMLEILGLEEYFIQGYGAPRPKKEHISNILQRYGYSKDEVAFIGDSPKDREAALENGILFIARDRGLDSLRDEKLKIADLCELPKLLECL